MAFKENLLKKIKIKQMAQKVILSIGPPESGKKVDKTTMREILALGPYAYRKERDLDLYVHEENTETPMILVLDNDLPFYRTTPDDVVLRKSPTIREMVSIRNVIKILNDADVVVSKKEASVETVKNECIRQLDLRFEKADLDQIAEDGRIDLKLEDSDGVILCLSMFAELLGFESPPFPFKMKYYEIWGKLSRNEAGNLLFGPAVIYSLADNNLRLMAETIDGTDKARLQFYKNIVSGRQAAAMNGEEVLNYLEKLILRGAG